LKIVANANFDFEPEFDARKQVLYRKSTSYVIAMNEAKRNEEAISFL